MSQSYSLKIDIFCHILPAKYRERLYKLAPEGTIQRKWLESLEVLPTLFDMNQRFRIMDKYEGLAQVLTITSPPVECVAKPKLAADLARLANDEMAELVFKYPDRFAAAVACLPMNNMDATLDEVDRTINDLKFRGAQVYTPVNDKPLDLPEFLPLFEKMSQYNLPIWIHPTRTVDYPDYRSETLSKYRMFLIFGWPYETTVAMTRLVFGGIFERYPNLKFITHHGGGMVPFLEDRIIGVHDLDEIRRRENFKQGLTKAPIEYFKMFYLDTAIFGNASALKCVYDFSGAEHMLFGTDFPHDVQLGERYIRQTINAVEQMDIPESDKKKIFEDNARRIMRLPL
ncbi:amidohydrolase family protein [Chloroflexota bacterium]